MISFFQIEPDAHPDEEGAVMTQRILKPLEGFGLMEIKYGKGEYRFETAEQTASAPLFERLFKLHVH